MGTARFYKEMGEVMRDGDEHDHAQRMQMAYEAVRDAWLAGKEYTALVKAILGNWTSGNCVPYMQPLTAALVGDGEHTLHRTLWARTIQRQVEGFFREYAALRGSRISVDALLAADTSGFDEHDVNRCFDAPKACAFLLQRLFDSLAIWRGELVDAGMPCTEPDAIGASLRRLRKPPISVSRLPAG